MKPHEQKLREQLRALLSAENAHQSLERIVEDLNPEYYNLRMPGSEYTPWRLLEHIRIAQRDILDFIRDPDYASPEWPAGYWPPEGQDANEDLWRQTIESILEDRKTLIAFVLDPDIDLYADLPHAPGYTILREILVVADHNAYHVGELGLLCGLLAKS